MKNNNETEAQNPITKREVDFSEWYHDVIKESGLAEYYPVKGCMVILPHGYAIWEIIQKVLDDKFKATGVENAYFPLFIPEKFLTKEKDHVEGFAPEVAVVTHAGNKELEEKLVVRPTSETIMYDTFSRWIRSYRDLPLLINQWANVVRWEMRTRMFLRTTEFLWQEGHTAHATQEEADERARMMLDIYRDFSENFMAIPVITGVKTESEKFAGALRTYTCETMMQDGKALQYATSHNLGDNFAKAFEITFLDENNETKHAWQTSWGLSTRSIGALIMSHGDDDGLVLPPKMAPIQVVIVPVIPKEWDKDMVMEEVQSIYDLLSGAGIRSKIDDRDFLSVGEKYYHWERKGVPLRIEIGPKDIANGKFVAVRRDNSEKSRIDFSGADDNVKKLLSEIQEALLKNAQDRIKENTIFVDNWDEFEKAIENNKFVMAHWDGTKETENEIKQKTGATIRCMPFSVEEENGNCVYSGKESDTRVLFAKAY